MKRVGWPTSVFFRLGPGTSWLAGTASALVLAGCAIGPDYKRPAVDVPPDWRWKLAEPKDHVPRGEWWTVFDDPNLNELQQTARTNNLDLQAAFHRLEQSRANARIRRSDALSHLWPRTEPGPV
jgi:multidrug efflux system outer membrane protein